jgi:threonine synthase
MHKDRPLWVRYDLESVGRNLDKKMLHVREPTLWRYRELLPAPVGKEICTLGEGMSPLLHCRRLGDEFGLKDIWVKDESQLPTGSFKCRGLSVAVTMAKHMGIRKVAIPSNGNAGGAMAAYAARAGIEAIVLMPDYVPALNQYECHLAGARSYLVNGDIADCGRIIRDQLKPLGWFDMSTLKEPYRVEGKKTMGLELAEQFDWSLPDVILYPTGGGTGLIGMWKAFRELSVMGWIDSENGKNRLPRMCAVQSDGCCPIVDAYERKERFAKPFRDAHTIATGIHVPSAVGDFMILDAIRESNGIAISVEEDRIVEWMRLVYRLEGIPICPETAACVGALEKLAIEGWIQPDDRVVIFNTASSLKYSEKIAFCLPIIDKDSQIDWSLDALS